MSHAFGFIIESLVAVLLTVTIGYCVLLNKRLLRLKADEHSLKVIIVELVAATETAERAIAGLKTTVRESDQNLGERLRTAERFSSDMESQLVAGEQVLARLAKIVAATRPEAAPVGNTRTMVAAAQAFAERTRLRVDGRAA